MLELCRAATLLGTGDFSGQFFSCARRCLKFEVSFESEIVSDTDQGQVSTKTKGKVKLRPLTLSPNDEPDMALGRLLFSGASTWQITDMQQPSKPDDNGCVVGGVHVPTAGSPSRGCRCTSMTGESLQRRMARPKPLTLSSRT
jgi:hypothetical protein